MSIFDVRNENNEKITQIVFASDIGEDKVAQAFAIRNYLDNTYGSYICIEDSECDKAVINTEQHALDLIKALNKAIELGWLK